MEMPLKNTGKVLDLAWDKDGDSVAILQVSLILSKISFWKFSNFEFKFYRKITPLWFGIQVRRV